MMMTMMMTMLQW